MSRSSVGRLGNILPLLAWTTKEEEESLDLETLQAQADATGWAVGAADEATFRRSAHQAGWTEVAVRRGDSTAVQLRPTDTQNAHPSSMSASVGLGPQPLHVDGAHHEEPPKYIALMSATVSHTPTLVWRVQEDPNAEANLRSGLFIVGTGNARFLATAKDNSGLYRFDPSCMSPADQRARAVSRFFADALASATPVTWDTPNKILLIANRIALHARARVAAVDAERVVTRVAFDDRNRP